ncbi:hypothetical protein C8Q78DRAFT_998516 [Trametes maxima]|nr:hypothetical protein C8Q78DRAFT_998516 [Trametes maxima]
MMLRDLDRRARFRRRFLPQSPWTLCPRLLCSRPGLQVRIQARTFITTTLSDAGTLAGSSSGTIYGRIMCNSGQRTGWRKLPRGKCMVDIAPTGVMPSKKFPEPTHCGAPPTFHWVRMGEADPSTCPACGNGHETVVHYLLVCEAFDGTGRFTSESALRATPGPPWSESEDALRPLFNYIHATGRFRASLGALDYPASDGGEPDD